MPVNRRRRRRRRTAVAAAAALTTGLLTGCEFGDSADCLPHADAVAWSITAIDEAGADAIEDPSRTGDSIATIEKNLDEFDDGSDDTEAGRAVNDLHRAIRDYNQDILDGRTPDANRIDKAAAELRDLCAS
ncbi:hypothetical protein [Streptomyces sp. NPDC001388]|uniref:hypothetical protein n=1 Tax=Streptomyces sp. NPDC001388 TaxID=3364568 RepID=UPI003689DBDC